MSLLSPTDKKEKSFLLKLSEKEKNLIQENAQKYCDGNVSQWIRASATKFKPKKVWETKLAS